MIAIRFEQLELANIIYPPEIRLLTYGRRIPLAELFARIDAVNASTIKRVANRFIYDRDIAIASMGPVKELPDYNWFRRRTYWNRY
ncbi:hypothetical protein GBA52_021937 [Prunus armeniaca]|nr:hypothetical protein GBA52_021937 [Prunus armeniaca]